MQSLAQGPGCLPGVTAARKGLLENLLGPPGADVSASGLLGLPGLQLGERTCLPAWSRSLWKVGRCWGGKGLTKVTE